MSPSERDKKPEFAKRSLLKKPTSDLTLAEVFKKRRHDLKMSLADVERGIKVQQIYLQMIEKGDYSSLPDDIYSKGFVKNYAEFLGFEAAPILELYEKERKGSSVKAKGSATDSKKVKMGVRPIDSKRVVVTPKTLLIVLGVCLVMLVVGYIGWQFSALSAPPKLTLENTAGQTVSTNSIYISGRVDGGSDLFINDSPILSSPDGSFKEKVSLVDGANQIKVTAKNKLGKTATINKTVVAHLPQVATLSPTPTPGVPLDGVELTVKVSGQAAWIIVETDGHEAFRQTMLPGTQQVFRAKNQVKLTTGNAGATALVLTNSVVSNKDIGSLGRPGEVKAGLIFNKDTQVQ